MYYDDEDDDPYAPRIGPAAMPSPRSKFAPYYSGHANTFEDFLEEYEGLAYDRALTDPQRVDVIIRYVAPSLRDFWRSLDGYRSHDWPLFRQSLVNIFGNPTPRHQIMRQKLRGYIQDSARKRMYCEDDVLRYYRQFICFGLPLVHAGHLSGEERDAAFWYGFHPDDRQVIRPRLLGKNPFQPSDIPFHFEDVLSCARAAFAYDNYFQSPWSHAKQFEPPSVRHVQPVVEPIPRDAYSFRAVTRAVTTYAETTPDDSFLPSYSTPDSDFPLSSISPSESQQHTQAPSVTLDQPEPTYTLSNTLPPSDHPLSHTRSLARSATDNDPIFASTPPSSSVSSTFLPSASPTLSRSHSHSLAHVAADVPEISSTPSPSTSPAPFSIPTSDFEYLPSATVDQPEAAPTLSSTPPSSSSISPTFLPSPVRLATEDQPEPEPEHASLSIPTSPFLPAPSLALEFTDDVPELSSLAFSEYSTSLSSPTKPPSSETPTSMPSDMRSDPHSVPAHSSLSLRSSSGDSSDTLVELVVVPVSLNSSSLSLSLAEPIPFLPASLEAPPIAPISPCSTLPQRPPGLKTVGSDSSLLETTPPLASSVQSQELSLVYEASPVLAPRLSLFHSSGSLRHTPARFGFALALVTTAILSSLLNVSKALSVHSRKFWSKYEDFGNSQNGIPKARNIPAQRLRLGQFTPRAPRLVFDPGGSAFAPDLGT